jgi:diacylglycerol O-acyltransferase
MQQLTGVDATFLYMETPTTCGHVSSLTIFDPMGTDASSIEKVKELYRERLPLLTPMRRRLVEVPLNLDHPYWIEDPELDLDFHIRETAVAPPGTPEQLAELVSRLIARPLDRSRPLWELYIINGLPDGRVAQLTKIHHATIDGVGGAQLLMHLVDLEPDPAPRDIPPLPEPEPVPTELEMLGRGLSAMAMRPYVQSRLAVRLARDVARATGIDSIGGAAEQLAKMVPAPVQQLLGRRVETRAEDQMSGTDRAGGGGSAPPTPFNKKISAHRRFAYFTLSLDDAKTVKNAVGCTLNDVVLGLCAEVLRRYLLKHDALPEQSLRCMIPVSTRTDDEKDSYGNKVSSMFADLCTDVEDPIERLKYINESTKQAKESLNALPADLLTDAAEFAPPAILARANRVVARTQLANRVNPPFNVVISNVPGPQFPIYAAGARMEHYYPVSTITDSQGLNITLQSFDGGLDFGLVADRDLVPDLWDMAKLFEDVMAELVAATAPKATTPRAATTKAPAKAAAKKKAARKSA